MEPSRVEPHQFLHYKGHLTHTQTIWLWFKIKQEGLRGFWSMFPLTRVPFWYRFFQPQPYETLTPNQNPVGFPDLILTSVFWASTRRGLLDEPDSMRYSLPEKKSRAGEKYPPTKPDSNNHHQKPPPNTKPPDSKPNQTPNHQTSFSPSSTLPPIHFEADVKRGVLVWN